MSDSVSSNPIDVLLSQWDTDSQIDSSEPGVALLNIPRLHAKYLRVLSRHSVLAKKVEGDLAALRKVKADYYGGRLEKEELDKLGLQQFKYLLKNEVKDYVDADADVIALSRKKAAHDEVVRLCEAIVRELNARTYQLRSYIDYLRWSSGQ